MRTPFLESAMKMKGDIFFPSSEWLQFVDAVRDVRRAGVASPEFIRFFNQVNSHAYQGKDTWGVLVLGLSKTMMNIAPNKEESDLLMRMLKELYDKSKESKEPEQCLQFFMFALAIASIVGDPREMDSGLQDRLHDLFRKNSSKGVQRYFEILQSGLEEKKDGAIEDSNGSDLAFDFLERRLADRDMKAGSGKWVLKGSDSEAEVPDCSWSWYSLARARWCQSVSGIGFPREWRGSSRALRILWILSFSYIVAALGGVVFVFWSRHF